MVLLPNSTTSLPKFKIFKMREEEKKRKLEEMRAALPVLDLKEIRRHKLPFYKAFLIELEEEQFYSAATFIKQLIKFQQDVLKKYGKQCLMWSKPRLHESKKMLEFIGEYLKKAEDYHYSGDYEAECDIFLKIAEHNTLRNDDWVWLKEQILIQALEISKYVPDEGKSRVLALFFYGRLLYRQLGHSAQLVQIMTEVNNSSRDTIMFTHEYDRRTRYYTLNNQARNILYECYLEESRMFLEIDPEYVLNVIREAKFLSSFGDYAEATFEMFLLQSVAYLALKKIVDGCISIRKAFSLFCRMYDDVPAYKHIIEMVQNGIQVMKKGDTMKALKLFSKIKRIYSLQFVTFYINLIYKYLGQYYLCKGVPSFATPVFMVGYKEFNKLYRKYPEKYLNQLLELRILTACSAAQELWPIYTKVIVAAGKRTEDGQYYLNELMRWKDTREILWPGCEKLSYYHILYTDMYQALVKLFSIENYAFAKIPSICWADWTAGYDDSQESVVSQDVASLRSHRISLQRVSPSELNLKYYPNAVNIRASVLRRSSSDRGLISSTSFKSMDSIFL